MKFRRVAASGSRSRTPVRSPLLITVIDTDPIRTTSGGPGESGFITTAAPSTGANVTTPPDIRNTPARFGKPSRNTTSDSGSDPTTLSPSRSQKRPATASQLSGAFSFASRSTRHCATSCKYPGDSAASAPCITNQPAASKSPERMAI